ncbi:hypothetical protein ACW6QP_03245 [Salegentibacter sp. HM20]
MNKSFGILLSIFFLISCNIHNQSKEEIEIYSLMIDELAIAFPLPPMPSQDDLEAAIDNTNWDSIKSVKTTLVVDTVMFRVEKRISLPQKHSEFEELNAKIINLPAKVVNKDLLKSKEGHSLIYGNSLEDFIGDYPQMVFISRIAFNDDLTKAFLFAGHATGRLSGFLNLYLLQKENERWKIIYKKNVEVS